MTQQFKFGDIVRFASEPTQIGVVFEVTDKNIQIGWNDGYTSFQKHDDPLELIPHPDTVRLDFIQKNRIEIKLIENEDGQLFFTEKDGIFWEVSLSEAVRQSIDTMIREYEA